MELNNYPFSEKYALVSDRLGVSWQVVPTIIERSVTDKDNAKREKVLAAIMKMQKLDIAELEKAYNN